MTRVQRQRMFGESLLWAVAVGLLGWGAFGWPGIACGAVVAALHIWVRTNESNLPDAANMAWHLIVLPALLGVMLAASPIMLWFFLAPALLVLWLGTSLPSVVPRGAKAVVARLASLLVMGATLLLCAISPKHMDREVGPSRYHRIQLEELCSQLRRDHDIACRLEPGLKRDAVEFEIPRPMSRRDVLHKLARENELDLWLFGCGTGATLLRGAHYSASLSERRPR